jgi:hypothetical protein
VRDMKDLRNDIVHECETDDLGYGEEGALR